MTILVADVGGTNSRLAVASHGKLDVTTIRRFRNADHRSIYHVIEDFRQHQHVPAITACTVAMAGPVTAQRAKLTNVDWEITATGLREATSCRHVLLMNDLTALGYALGHLPATGLEAISETTPDGPQNGQFLVAGLGTGFNVCPVKMTENGHAVCVEAEFGHVAPPLGVLRRLEIRFPGETFRFASVEDCFSGRGLSQLHALMAQDAPIDAATIFANHALARDRNATAALELLAELLGVLAREMVLQYLPLNGLYFAGSVARGVFDAGFAPVFRQSFADFGRFAPQLGHVPVSVIKDDAAALIGCVAASGGG